MKVKDEFLGEGSDLSRREDESFSTFVLCERVEGKGSSDESWNEAGQAPRNLRMNRIELYMPQIERCKPSQRRRKVDKLA